MYLIPVPDAACAFFISANVGGLTGEYLRISKIFAAVHALRMSGEYLSCNEPARRRSLIFSMSNKNKMRMDKWLWAARFFKTRALAARACELGRILSNGQPAKPAREVKVGDMLQVSSDAGEFQLEVLLLSEMRGPASVAQTLYRETDESRELRVKLAEERKATRPFEISPEGRPSKRDRREINRLRGRT
jgi:ribosome-associated heat shock protein Hsp15